MIGDCLYERNVALPLRAHTMATGAALVALIPTFGSLPDDGEIGRCHTYASLDVPRPTTGSSS
jgi:hypothetical protein